MANGPRAVAVCIGALLVGACSGSSVSGGASPQDASLDRTAKDAAFDDSEASHDAAADAGDATVGPSAALDGGPDVADAALDDAAPGSSCGASAAGWSRVPSSPEGTQIMGSGPRDIWLLANPPEAGVYGGQALMRGDGTTWNAVDFPVADADVPCPSSYVTFYGLSFALWVNGPNDVWTSGAAHAVMHWNGAQWATYCTNGDRDVDSLWSSGSDDVWGAGRNAPYLGSLGDAGWMNDNSLYGGVLAGGARRDFWVANYSTLLHHSPSSADAIGSIFDTSTVNLRGLGCAIGDAGIGDSNLVEAGWASGVDDVWFVGAGAFHYDGSTWSCTALPTNAQLHGVWGTSKTNVWAVGDGGTILHYDGTSWSSVSSPSSGSLRSVWTSPCDVWVIGDAVYHRAAELLDAAGAEAATTD